MSARQPEGVPRAAVGLMHGRGYVSFSGTTVSARQPEGVPRAAVGLMHGRGYVSFSEATVKAE